MLIHALLACIAASHAMSHPEFPPPTTSTFFPASSAPERYSTRVIRLAVERAGILGDQRIPVVTDRRDHAVVPQHLTGGELHVPLRTDRTAPS